MHDRALIDATRPALSVATLNALVERLAPALERARTGAASFNIMALAGIGRNEVRNAYALSRLLDPIGAHGLGTLPLAGLFEALSVAAPSAAAPSDLSKCRVAVEHRPLGSERDRVDLVVDHPELLLYIELKVGAGEGDRQLARYAEAAAQEAAFRGRPAWCLVYLTCRPATDLPSDIPNLRWRTLAQTIRARLVLAQVGPHVQAPVIHLLDHFAML